MACFGKRPVWEASIWPESQEEFLREGSGLRTGFGVGETIPSLAAKASFERVTSLIIDDQVVESDTAIKSARPASSSHVGVPCSAAQYNYLR